MPNTRPLISIITPAYKAEGTITRAVRSVLAQSYIHWEMLIVSDDESDYKILLAAQGIDDKRLRFFAIRAMETVDKVPFVGRVMHEYHVVLNSICHAADAHNRAERAYSCCLEKISSTGMGFMTLRGRQIAEQMLIRKRDLNRRYAKALAAGICKNFQQFISSARELPIDLYTSTAKEVC